MYWRLKDGVLEKRIAALQATQRDAMDLLDTVNWMGWARRVRPTLHLHARGWVLKTRTMRLECEAGQLLGDAYLHFWLTGDTQLMRAPRASEMPSATELAALFEAETLESLS